MARDHALAEGLEEGSGVLRLYRWSEPTLSLGRNEPAAPYLACPEVRSGAVGLVRRPTGGRAVLHHDELTYAVIVPHRALGGPRRAYHEINAGLVDGLRLLGASVALSGPASGSPRRPDAGPCFEHAAAGEVVAAGGRKLLGSAQARLSGALLQHGSLPLSAVPGVPGAGGGAGGGAVALAEILAPLPSWERLVEALSEALLTRLGVPGEASATRDIVLDFEREEALYLKYASGAWTQRR